MKRYKPNQNGKNKPAVNKSNGGNGHDLIKSENTDKPWQFKKGQAVPGCGRPKGRKNKIPGDLLEAIIKACESVGYDKNVIVRDAKGRPMLDEDGRQIIDEKQRIKGLEPYIRRTAELHRPVMASMLSKIASPAVVQLMVAGSDTKLEMQGPSLKELEQEVARLGLTINIFHGDGGNKPIPLTIDHEPSE